MSDEPAADLGLIARQQRQILAEIGSARDGLNVLTAISMWKDATLTALLNAVRAMRNSQMC